MFMFDIRETQGGKGATKHKKRKGKNQGKKLKEKWECIPNYTSSTTNITTPIQACPAPPPSPKMPPQIYTSAPTPPQHRRSTSTRMWKTQWKKKPKGNPNRDKHLETYTHNIINTLHTDNSHHRKKYIFQTFAQKITNPHFPFCSSSKYMCV